MYPSSTTASRLIVFVHGFGGSAISTWNNFAKGQQESRWWMESDLLFVGYNSKRDGIKGVADRLRRNLPRFYPTPYGPAMSFEGNSVREDISSPYSELIVVGHSLGGLIVRHAVVDEADEWLKAGRMGPKPLLLDSTLRLFSPASAGFRAAGVLGVARASGFWPALEMYLRRSSAYTDMQPGSTILLDTRARTERIVDKEQDMDALQARILWASPDQVVIEGKYDSDVISRSVDGQSHRSVCKPRGDYPAPWEFVERGVY
ncbi:putative lipase (plasmid) [Pseudarthrobacter sp. Fe7]|nr:putative lipase [Pseudarthrobacter sp. Fe7]